MTNDKTAAAGIHFQGGIILSVSVTHHSAVFQHLITFLNTLSMWIHDSSIYTKFTSLLACANCCVLNEFWLFHVATSPFLIISLLYFRTFLAGCGFCSTVHATVA